MTVEIIEIIDRSEQGITLPFICRGDDDLVYFVKGRGAGRRSLICEWIASCLAKELGIPIAPFALVYVSEDLINLRSREDLSQLGEGTAFGSCRRSIVELTVSHVIQVPDEIQRDVLIFDWWIRNGDRTQTDLGGNPNLFWDVDEDQLVVLDHNQAFDPNFDPGLFGDLHPFRAHINDVFSDMFDREQYATRFEAVMATWDAICDTIPPEWWFLDAECTIPVEFDRAALKQSLLDCRSNAFWTIK
jgi:hypothetical protein